MRALFAGIAGSRWASWCACAVIFACCLGTLCADQSPPATLPESLRPISDFLESRSRAIEDEIAAAQRKGTDAAPDPMMDLRVDARLVARWLILNARNTPDGSDAQCAIYMHARAMMDLVPRIDSLAESHAAMSPIQREAAKRIHELTYRLGDVTILPAEELQKEAGQSRRAVEVDQPCMQVATDLLPLLGLPTNTALVPMRPAPAGAEAATKPSAAGASIADLAAAARAAAIGVPLRNALGVLADQTQKAADAHHADEAKVLRDALQSAVQTAAGLQSNTGVAPEQRQAAEDALTDAATLLADARTRSAGVSRLAALDQYRQLAQRVAGLNIPPEMATALAPAFQWIAGHPEDRRLVDAVWKFVDLAAHPPQAGAIPDGTDAMRRCAEELARQFPQQQTAVLAASSAMSSGGSGQDVVEHVGQMQRLSELTEIVNRLPRTLQSLHALHPHPRDGIEQHLWPALTAIGSAQPSAARDAADRQIRLLDELAGIASAWAAPSQGGPGPDDSVQSWTGGNYAGLDAYVRTLLAQAASAFAADAAPGSRAGGVPDKQTFDRLHQALALRSAVNDAEAIERDLARLDEVAPMLGKWADWQCPRARLSSMFDPYRTAMSSALAGLPVGSPDAVKNLVAVQKRFGPLVAFVRSLPDRGGALRDLPDGDAGLLSRLATPMQGKPFAAERFITLVADDWAGPATTAHEPDDAATRQAAAMILDRLIQPK